MPSIALIRLALLSLAVPALLPAQTPSVSSVKPNASAPSSTLPATSVPTPPPTPSQLPPHRAQITYAAGELSVSASNSSLNQILREISHETGLKISGGVTDERVFGQYGPGVPAQVLAALLDGTGSNMLILHSDGPTPGELILTPRQGGATPPNPNAAAFDDTPEYHNPSNVEAPEQQSSQPLPNASPAAPVTPATAPAAVDPSQPQSPNSARTPQQIYDQLQRLRQQQSTAPQ